MEASPKPDSNTARLARTQTLLKAQIADAIVAQEENDLQAARLRALIARAQSENRSLSKKVDAVEALALLHCGGVVKLKPPLSPERRVDTGLLEHLRNELKKMYGGQPVVVNSAASKPAPMVLAPASPAPAPAIPTPVPTKVPVSPVGPDPQTDSAASKPAVIKSVKESKPVEPPSTRKRSSSSDKHMVPPPGLRRGPLRPVPAPPHAAYGDGSGAALGSARGPMFIGPDGYVYTEDEWWMKEMGTTGDPRKPPGYTGPSTDLQQARAPRLPPVGDLRSLPQPAAASMNHKRSLSDGTAAAPATKVGKVTKTLWMGGVGGGRVSQHGYEPPNSTGRGPPVDRNMDKDWCNQVSTSSSNQ
ncbi:hypothetical protein BDK51DRAFT_28730 [Blyttiomyces helicus]|uniref:Uncharacterized protein n=1 Tax=Blyttiomyces helicus TaxID=388810 RepID=A0A4P9WBU2_9FUNG|nr:hypothetical protein BDK51DRAFT_28730 [Blyttiomyces helicus]|eukprot:RKO89095.1 hypothetical protein BDK51DRAFT_28730 [Blyttiomyces helicus]